MNNLNPFRNYITEGQVKKRLINKIMNRSHDYVYGGGNKEELPKRWTSTTIRAVGTKKGRTKMLNSNAAKRVRRQAIENGSATPEIMADVNKKFINRNPIQ